MQSKTHVALTGAGIIPVLNVRKERERQEKKLGFLFLFLSLQTWNICFLQWKIRSNTGKNFLTETAV